MARPQASFRALDLVEPRDWITDKEQEAVRALSRSAH
jgi:hypothetical protein